MFETQRRRGLHWVNSKYIYGRLVRHSRPPDRAFLTSDLAIITHHNILYRDGDRSAAGRQIHPILRQEASNHHYGD